MSNTESKRLDLSTPAGLEELQNNLAARCRERISAGEQPMPEVVVVLKTGKLEIFVCPVRNFAEKRAFQATVKQRCLRMDVGAAIATCDAWHVQDEAASPDEARARMGDLEQHPDRKECVSSVLATPQGMSMLIIPYTRTPEGIVWEAPERKGYLDSGVVSQSSEWDPWQQLRRLRTAN